MALMSPHLFLDLPANMRPICLSMGFVLLHEIYITDQQDPCPTRVRYLIQTASLIKNRTSLNVSLYF